MVVIRHWPYFSKLGPIASLSTALLGRRPELCHNSRTMDLIRAAAMVSDFVGDGLGRTLAQIELSLRGAVSDSLTPNLAICKAEPDLLTAAGHLKNVAGQINVVIHAVGMLLCLPHILEPGETIDYVSLGAGNTGRPFDLETDRRIAEFKFIRWRGGAEVIRQNSLFKDFFLMAEHMTPKRKFLYVLGAEQPMKFMNSRRALSSVLSRYPILEKQLQVKYGNGYRTVQDYYAATKDSVIIMDVSEWVPELINAGEASVER